ncbi:DUF2147 domain-containing protein [Bradyrhizobium sediminis]|uniref:DUF2147 domain-containing protein n=1 Tax=Bradyrhizobium sediminis TaxID=2840469 RepID=A0A975NM95_9BRAD|nr:DUF2147 domain-containing protein [Bradyrhizobium sediminis]QWG17440.1 DUF2147 domain-containing protein [Bradyrhizobium sediminis]
MKRFWFLVVLMALSSSADAGNSLSFVVGGHRIRIEAPRHCHSTSCVTLSIPGIQETRRWRDLDDDEREAAAPVTTVTAAAPVPAQAVPPASNSPVAPAAAAPPPAVFKPAAAATQPVAAPPPAGAPATVLPPAALPPLPPVERPAEAAPPRPEPAPQVQKASHRMEDEPADTPLGDWQSEGSKGTIRIERCGRALCGYAIHSPSNDKGEAVLVNMKPKTDSQWTGSVYSHDSGDTYYGTMALKGANSLRVEACALGRFYCSGNVWTRIGGNTERLMTSRQIAPQPRS